MLIKPLSRRSFKTLRNSNFRCEKHGLAVKEEEKAVTVRDEPKYPRINDNSLVGKMRQERNQWYDLIKSLPTVEQKLHEIVTKRSYFLKSFHVSACSPTYVGVPFQPYVTRTHFIERLPEILQTSNVDQIFADLKTVLYDELQSSVLNIWKEDQSVDWANISVDSSKGNVIIDNLLSLCSKSLSLKYPHLLDIAIDKKPMVRSYWYHGDFKSPRKYIIDEEFFRVSTKIVEPYVIRVNRQLQAENFCFQFSDYPYYTIRANNPLPPIVPLDDALCATPEVAEFNYLPKCFGIPCKNKYYINCLPGVWYGEEIQFPFLQIYTLDKMASLLSNLNHHDVQVIENGMAVMSSFGWLNGLSTYLGFTPYHDLTYPIVGQTILSNGKEWGFYIYQLNTICFHEDVDKKDRRNLCWFSGKMNLFETVEDGKIKGINDDVLKMLLKFVLNKPDCSPQVDLKPYLGEDQRSDEEIKLMRTELRKIYRNSYDPFKEPLYEVPMWVHVYKRHKLAPPTPLVKLK